MHAPAADPCLDSRPDHPAADPVPDARTPRHDGWTADRQRRFLEAIADGHTVDAACATVGLSASAAYALRRRAPGAAFALGWNAANLLAREAVADALLARAIDGQTETITRADGSVIHRHRYDNRLAATMLARLDRAAAADGPGAQAAARLVAGDFDAFLDLVARDAGPARAGLFLAARGEGDLEPIHALARADRFCRSGAALAQEVDLADLDAAVRDGWTAEQWCRAEAAGLVRLAPPPPPPPAPAEPPVQPASSPQLHEDREANPVWWCPYADAWRTRFPPPADFDGTQHGRFGDEDYERELSADEEDIVEAPVERAAAVQAIEQGRARDAWFARCAAIDAWPDADADGDWEAYEDGEGHDDEADDKAAIDAPGAIPAIVPGADDPSVPPAEPPPAEPSTCRHHGTPVRIRPLGSLTILHGDPDGRPFPAPQIHAPQIHAEAQIHAGA